MNIITWLQANSSTLWFAISVLVVLAVYLWARYVKSGSNIEKLATEIAHEAIAAALIVVRGAADQVKREDLDVIVAFIWIRVPPQVAAFVTLDAMKQKAWDIFTQLHADLDANRKAQIIGVVNQSRTVRARVA
jgi:hypothetical protein